MSFIIGSGDAGILAIARGNKNGGVIFEKAVKLPTGGSIGEPVMVAVDEEGVKRFYIIEVKWDILFGPIERRNDR